MLLTLPLVALAATPFTLSLDPIRSDVEAVTGERLTSLMLSSLRRASTGTDVEVVDQNATVRVSGRFAPKESGYRLVFQVRSPNATKALAFDYRTTNVGEVGALKIDGVILRDARVVCRGATASVCNSRVSGAARHVRRRGPRVVATA